MWQNFLRKVASFMQGRYGNDQLSFCIIVVGLCFYIASMLTGLPLLNSIGLVLYVWALFRIFSKNKIKRADENRKFLALRSTVQKKYTQFVIRVRNRKVYKYIKCPKCKALLRLKRGTGKTVVTCARCKHEFNEKA